MPLRYLRPLRAIGDSHSGPLNGLVLRDPATGEPDTFGQAWCVQGLSTRTALQPDGEPHTAVIAALAGFHLLRSLAYDYAGDAVTVKLGDRHFTASFLAKTAPVLFLAGELDAREIVASIPGDAEPLLPFEADLSALPSTGAGAPVPAAVLQERIVRTFRPLFSMLQKLKRLGLERIALASLPPPTPDDDEYFRLTGVRCSARSRYAVHLFINSLLRTYCTQSDTIFIDTWAQVTDDNVVKPGYLVDGLHFGPEGAEAVLQQLRTLVLEVSVP
jgi:hypothetical protein